jgi:type II secretory pathway component PulJ
MTKDATLLVALVLGFAWAVYNGQSQAHAELQPTLDRALVERLVRAEEAQTRALEALVRATERCRR